MPAHLGRGRLRWRKTTSNERANADPYSNLFTDADAIGDPSSLGDANTYAQAEPNAHPNRIAHADTETKSNTDSNAQTKSNANTIADAYSDADAHSYTYTNADSYTDTDSNSHPDTDTRRPLSRPDLECEHNFQPAGLQCVSLDELRWALQQAVECFFGSSQLHRPVAARGTAVFLCGHCSRHGRK